jgi:hypothetical protein
MSQSPNNPYYSRNPIHSLAALSKALGFEEAFLVELADTSNHRYRLAKPITKPDGSIRQPFDALDPLKEVHRRLKKELFSKVVFPQYLTGSLKGRDYRVNALLHTGAKIVICEDIEGFFPSTNSSLVMDIWQNFFGFSPEVSELLTKLTTKDGLLPQGAITSSFLANLAFWRTEPWLHDQLLEQGIVYSRYVDDITISSKHRLENENKTKVIAAIYGMLRKSGYSAKRRKHEIATSGNRMLTTKLLINKKPALKPEERANIRTAVFQLEQKISQGINGPDITRELNRVAGLVGKLSRFHITQSNSLKNRILNIRKLLKISNIP